MNNSIPEKLQHCKYIFAKTMPHNPHWYTLRKDWDSSEFDRAVEFIRKNGIAELFAGRVYTVLYHGKYKYWTMGAPIRKTILINRKEISQTGYNQVAPIYDSLHIAPEALLENEQIISQIKYTRGEMVLDIGCGSGLFIEYTHIPPQDYYGIDSSSQMLLELIKKFPAYRTRVIKASAGEYIQYCKRNNIPLPFNVVLALFGVGSYLSRQQINTIKHIAPKYFIMYYKPEYFPNTHNHMDKRPSIKASYTKSQVTEAFPKYFIEEKQ